MFKKVTIGLAAIGSGFAWGAFVAARRVWHRWGIDPSEALAGLAGDEFVVDPVAVDTRGIDIAAPPETVWPWLVQMGYGRGGWYSYDGLDMDRSSVDRILPELQDLAVGEIVPTHPGGGFEVKVVDPGRALVLYSDREQMLAQAAGAPEGLESATPNVRATGAYLSRAVSGDFAASWAFVLRPTSGGTRLIERFRIRMDPPATTPAARPIPAFARGMLGFGVFVMVRRQMIGIRDRAEGRPLGPVARRLAVRFPTRPSLPEAPIVEAPTLA